MDEPVASSVPQQVQPIPRAKRWVSVGILMVILGAIPVTVIYLGQKTRLELKAAQDCRTPPIPDPSECAGGEWKLYKNETGCVRFRCELR